MNQKFWNSEKVLSSNIFWRCLTKSPFRILFSCKMILSFPAKMHSYPIPMNKIFCWIFRITFQSFHSANSSDNFILHLFTSSSHKLMTKSGWLNSTYISSQIIQWTIFFKIRTPTLNSFYWGHQYSWALSSTNSMQDTSIQYDNNNRK